MDIPASIPEPAVPQPAVPQPVVPQPVVPQPVVPERIAPSAGSALGRAEVRRFTDALTTIGRDAVPSDPLARAVRSAVTALDRAGVSEISNERLAELLAPLDAALCALDEAHVQAATPAALIELIACVDDATSLLETPDLGLVPTDRLAGRLRELYGGIIRLRAVSSRLHLAWRRTGAGPSTPAAQR
jgi:hypothetical protein